MLRFALIIILTVSIIDTLALWRLQIRGRRLWQISCTIAFLNVAIIGSAFARMFAGDNSVAALHTQMWLFEIFIIFTIPRVGYYLITVWTRKPFAKILGSVFAAYLLCLLVYSVAYERTNIEIKEIEITSAKIPQSFNGYRIAQVTDIHVGTLVSPKRELQRLVEKLNSLSADMIAITGDLVHIQHTELTPEIMAILSSIKTNNNNKDGVYSVLGNHDIGLYANKNQTSIDIEEYEMLAKQQQMGWRVLNDETIYIGIGDDVVSLTGIAYERNQHIINTDSADVAKAYEGIPTELFNITLVHMPQLWHSIKEAGYGGLTLAGHVHAMQTKLNFFGREYSPAQFIYKEWSGLYNDSELDSNLYINDGIGYVLYPMRIGARPEITIFTLISTK